MPHKVPQNIDIEDKIIGPLTLKQFIYLTIGSGAIFVINYVLPPDIKFMFLPLAIIIGAFFGALAFFRPGDRPFEVLLASAIGSLSRPNKRVWKKIPYKKTETPEVKSEEAIPQKNVSNLDLKRLAFVVDSGGFEEELKGRGIVAGMTEKKRLEENAELKDTIAATEEKRNDLNDLISSAVEKIKAKKKEPTVSEMASVKPSKEFKYEKLAAVGGTVTEYEEILKDSKELQEKRFDTAKVVH